MASYIYVEDNGATACSTAGCSGRSNATSRGNAPAAVGGSATLSTLPVQIAISTNNVIFGAITMDVPGGFPVLAAQTLATKFRLSGSTGGTPLLTEVYVCRVDSGCTNIATCGSATGLSQSLASVTEYTQDVTIASDVTFNASDLLMVVFVGSNTSSMSAWTGSMGFNPAVNMTVVWNAAASATSHNLPLLGVG